MGELRHARVVESALSEEELSVHRTADHINISWYWSASKERGPGAWARSRRSVAIHLIEQRAGLHVRSRGSSNHDD